jgi:amphi-Trp domain-containing protein
MSKQKVSIEKLMEISDLVAYLEGLVSGLKEGCLVVQEGEKSLSLTPPSMLAVEIKAKRKKNKSKFAMELSWREPDIQQEKPEASGLDISRTQAQAPEPESKE